MEQQLPATALVGAAARAISCALHRHSRNNCRRRRRIGRREWSGVWRPWRRHCSRACLQGSARPSTALFILHTRVVDVERRARDFMEAAKKLQLYFIGLQHDDQPRKEEKLQKIQVMEEELKVNSELVEKYDRLIQGWRKELEDQLDKHVNELERV